MFWDSKCACFWNLGQHWTHKCLWQSEWCCTIAELLDFSHWPSEWFGPNISYYIVELQWKYSDCISSKSGQCLRLPQQFFIHESFCLIYYQASLSAVVCYVKVTVFIQTQHFLWHFLTGLLLLCFSKGTLSFPDQPANVVALLDFS